MAKTPKRTGGPTTPGGKAISSANAVTHGLTSKRWLNDDEQSLYEITVEQLTQDFAPHSTIESLLISKLAECTVRLTRTQNVETALYELAQAQAENPKHALESYEANLKNFEKEIAQGVHRYSFTDKALEIENSHELYVELAEHDFINVSGWQYVCDHMPQTREFVINQCKQEGIDLKSFLKHQINGTEVFTIQWVGVKPDGTTVTYESDAITYDEITAEAASISSQMLTEFLENKLKQLAKEQIVMAVIKDLPNRINLLQQSAMPDEKKLSLLQRYRTADERQFSKTLGELLELQKRRKDVN